MKALKLTYSQITAFLCFATVLALAGFDARTFLGNTIPIGWITSGILALIIFCFLSLYTLPYKGQRPLNRIRTLDILVVLFIVLYGLKLIYNIYVEQIEQTTFNNRITFAVYFLLLCILPYMICRRIHWEDIDIKKLLWFLFFVLLAGLVISYRQISQMLLMGENAYESRFNANDLLDTIGYGHMALSFILVCFSLSCMYKEAWRYAFIIPILFGILSMGLANSRSPFVALMAILSIYAIVKLNAKILLSVILICVLFILNINSINLLFKEQFNSSFIERFLTIFEFSMQNSSGRDAFYKEGMDMFLQYPVFGRAILLIGELKGGYVHNLFLEVLMSTGMIGCLFFLTINIKIIQSVFYLIKHNSQYLFFALIFIQFFIMLQFSRTLIVVPQYWMALSSVFTIYIWEKNKL